MIQKIMDKKGELRVLFLVDLPMICYRDYSFIMVTYAKTSVLC